MRIDLSFNRFGWLYNLDWKKLILIAFLFRFILASMYDIFVSVTDRDFLLPDGKFYSIKGRYVSLMLNGHNERSFTKDMIPQDKLSLVIFKNAIDWNPLFDMTGENRVYCFIIGIIYFVFGYFPLGVRVFNILMSISSAYFLFKIGERQFGKPIANLFLLVALFLPTQIVYSITLTKDLLRVFAISLVLWLFYGGVMCKKT